MEKSEGLVLLRRADPGRHCLAPAGPGGKTEKWGNGMAHASRSIGRHLSRILAAAVRFDPPAAGGPDRSGALLQGSVHRERRRDRADATDREYSEGEAGGWIIYSRLKDGWQLDIYSVKKDGTGTVGLATDPDEERFVAVSGNRVIFAKNYDDWSTWGDYFSVTVDGTDRRPLAMGVRYGDLLGDWLVYEREINLGNYDLYSVKTDGSITTVLAAASEEELFRGSLQGWVIFLRVYPTGNHDLYATPADGSGTITGITSGYGEVEFYREYGSQVVIISKLRNSQIDLYRVNANGAQRRNFTNNSYRDYFWFSTSNCHIYSSLINNQWDLYSYNFKTGATRVLANQATYHETVPDKGGGPVQ